MNDDKARAPHRVLLIDDASSSRVRHADILRDAGMLVQEEADLDQWFKGLTGFVPDVLVLSVRLAVCDGTDLLRQLQTRSGSTGLPIIFLIDEADPQSRSAMLSRVLAAGAENFLVLPVEPAILVALVVARCALKTDAQPVLSDRALAHELETERIRGSVLQRQADIGYWELNLVSNDLHWSEQIYRIFSLDPTKFRPAYQTFLDHIHPDDRQQVDSAYTRSLETREPYQIRHRLKLPSGQIKFVQECCETEFSAAGLPLISRGSVQDITHLVDVEQKLLFKSRAIDAAHSAIAMTASDGRINYVNAAFVSLLKLPGADAALGRMPNEFWKSPELVVPVINALQRDGVWQGELTALRHDGSHAEVLVTAASVRSASGEPIGIISSFQDMTDLRHAQNELSRERDFLENLLKCAPAVVLVLDVQARISYANPFFESLSGYSLEDIWGRDWFSTFLPEHDRERIREVFHLILAGDSFLGNVNPIMRRDGTTIDIEWHAIPMRDSSGKVTAVMCSGQDVTKRMSLERSERQSKQLVRSIFDSMYVFVAMFSPDGIVQEINDAPLQMGGMLRTDVIGRLFCETPWFTNSPATKGQVRRAILRAGAGESVREDIVVRAKDGQQLVIDTRFDAIRDEHGEIGFLIASGVDVTARRQAEDALAAQKRYLRAILDAEPECVKVLSQDCRLIDMNPAGLAMIGAKSLEDVLGKSALPLICEEYRENFFGLNQRVFAGSQEHFEYEIAGPNGERRHLETYMTPLEMTDGSACVLGVSRDVTERKRSEAALKVTLRHGESLLRSSRLLEMADSENEIVAALKGEVSIIFGYQNVWLYVPEPDGRHYQLAAREGKSVMAMFGDDAIIRHEIHSDPFLQELLQMKRLLIVEDMASDPRYDPQKKAAGNRTMVHVPLLAGNRCAGIICMGTFGDEGVRVPNEAEKGYLRSLASHVAVSLDRIELTAARRRAEEALLMHQSQLESLVASRTADLRRAKEVAEQANEAKTEFLSRMSHELRTPLNAVLGYAQLLETETGLTAEHREEVGLISTAGWHLLELINDLLDFSKIEAGRLELEIVSVDVGKVLAECLATVGNMAQMAGVGLPAALACTAKVSADPLRLRQALLNLLTNAIKYNREGGSVQVVCQPVDGARLRIEVRDTGVGIRKKDLGQLFVPFSRLYMETYAIEGSGIGLALTKELIEAMSGTIDVASVYGEGSTFTVELPLAGVDEQVAAALPSEKPPPHARALVLYIEDSPIHIRLVKDILARWGDFELMAAQHPAMGLALAATHQPALILMDINLPGMNGFEALQRLKENPQTRGIPVIAVSANALPAELAKGPAAGFANYLTKPVRLEELKAAIAQALADHSG